MCVQARLTIIVLGFGCSSLTKDHYDALKHLTCTVADSSPSEDNNASAAKYTEIQ